MAGLEFHVHDELGQRLSANAYYVFVRCGNWTARHAAEGVVPGALPFEVDYTPDALPIHPAAAIAELVAAGFWTPIEAGGWHMEFGPSDDWDSPMPLWRYSAPVDGGVEVAPGITMFPEPDA